MTTAFTKKGVNQSCSSEWIQGQKIYTKTKLTQDQISNYQRMMNLGVGVKVLSIKESTITM